MKACPTCNRMIAKNCQFCPGCGRKFYSSFGRFLSRCVIGFLGLIALGMAIGVAMNSVSSKPAVAPAAPAVQIAGTPMRASSNKQVSTGNIAHDRLSILPASEQAIALGQAVGEGCIGSRAFYQGMGKDRVADWSVLCKNGQSYEVGIAPDSTGSTTVLECSVLKAVAHMDCFKKF